MTTQTVEKHPKPWLAFQSAAWPAWGIEDAEGEVVVPPSPDISEATAKYIVACVNA